MAYVPFIQKLNFPVTEIIGKWVCEVSSELENYYFTLLYLT